MASVKESAAEKLDVAAVVAARDSIKDRCYQAIFRAIDEDALDDAEQMVRIFKEAGLI